MNIIHLYDKISREQGDMDSLCGKKGIIPNVDAVPIRLGQSKISGINFCENCMKSDHAVFWYLANI